MNHSSVGADPLPPIVLHPGFMKSATTTLQEHLFRPHSQIGSIGRPHYRPGHRALSEELRRIDGFSFRPAALAEHVRSELDRVLATTPDIRCVVLSDETLLANAYLCLPIAERLKAAFPEASIIITIRHQLDAITSYYARTGRVLFGAPRPFKDRHVSLESWLEHAWMTWETSFLGQVTYRSAVEIYERVFGGDRVRIFLFEELAHHPDRFVGSLSALLGVDAREAAHHMRGRASHRRESARHVAYQRFRRRLSALAPDTVALAGVDGAVPPAEAPSGGHARKAFRRFVQGGRSLRVDIPERWRRRLARRYAPHNEVLARRYDLPLARWGYPTPAAVREDD